ncbi:MAG: prolyl-tRNA synthetase [Candidatus Taylorbacteria bacterium RIFCSPLOWO2_12_FULL_43_20]|uniref:Proline--tRNA ligase n=1 Tax=Candidatus Taylorbacteria bacterium RIFCSPLOWO2_12_FULL_43_20 TaxID=1802332 RepID=A0A1G2P1Q6_9BACT|nr:MAG: prolyl-tRNA synthetase [Candidatus Taylorbacteria bacterium RIFCSPHIGHO2_01_FULL_43_120]OHA23883.1 MAG: prolyl-tRNA synthetase [Candidatus Taylorbacteria bacterium RIFCSPHIGHO2_02_FULL_43_55]OHA28955.1 MAG: prolyl-tRNA synthetase [Candidatus Taylorbacteria bacterium RIFCSPHIGHO2_12_FULL_42_34]OHA31844.1 MAG: prolyl-tRNA synthetase [Candidatus Taylorbacteria bacterium RIFCSPLOWO2_01_FULL_43_83]OHA37743.1 MAG: prolyl-tRNA synthetase [Candidatus Taylorbacteria bacterium RIFCSPLOWO2_02_FULL
MRQSILFTKSRKEAPRDEISVNASLLIRAGYIHKEMAGVYSYLPLGFRVLNKIQKIIREEMDAVGGQELLLTALQEKEAWEKTGRWSDEAVDNWFKTKLKNDVELGLAYTHEPAIASMMKEYVSSYQNLPFYAYQFQTKFRNELRAKSGLFRGREFPMKDLYSFSKNEEELGEFYEKMILAYNRIFNRIEIGDMTFLTLASGGTFGTQYSHEFQTLTSSGEDTIYLHKQKKIAINKEIYNDEALNRLGVTKEDLVEEKSIEIANIYKLGTFYSVPLGLMYKDKDGRDCPVVMGSYGIGVSRLMGAVAEVKSDKNGLIWPKEIAPFSVHLVALIGKDQKVTNYAEEIYKKLVDRGVEVLYDDRDLRAGEKFMESDLIGIPMRVVVSEKTESQKIVETKDRTSGEIKRLALAEFLNNA